MADYEKEIMAGKVFYVVEENQLREIKGLKEKLEVRLGDQQSYVEIVCYLTYPKGLTYPKRNIYILSDEFIKIPHRILCGLNYKDNRPLAVRKKRRNPGKTVSHKKVKKKKSKEMPAKHSGRVIVSSDSILTLCKKVTLCFAGNSYSVTGYVSEASGSLLVPAKTFMKEVPIENWKYINLQDPHSYLRKYQMVEHGAQIQWLSLQPQSVLSEYGYSVRASISRDDRRKILERIICNGVLTEQEVVSHIRSLIARNQNRYPAACARWKEDIEFVRQICKNKDI